MNTTPLPQHGPQRAVDYGLLADLYLSGKTQGEVAAEVGLQSRRAVAKAIAWCGVEKREFSKACRQTDVNDGAFDLLTPEACYFAGLLATDGCVYYPKVGTPQVHLELQVRDSVILDGFAAFVGGRARYGAKYGKVSVSSQALVQRLESFGVTQRKTHSLRILNEALLTSRDFWRGVLDGDGCVGTKQAHVFTASLEFSKQAATYVSGVLGCEVTPRLDRGRYFRLLMSTAKAAKVLSVLYHPGDVAIPRKMEAATEFVARWGK